MRSRFVYKALLYIISFLGILDMNIVKYKNIYHIILGKIVTLLKCVYFAAQLVNMVI
jgi:hypothetical protein